MPKEEVSKEERSSEQSSPTIYSESDYNVESEVPLLWNSTGREFK